MDITGIIEILNLIAIVSGGVLVILLVLSLVGGLDLDLDLGDSDVDSGGLGIIKSVLTFLTISSWVIKVILVTSDNPVKAFAIGIICGLLAVLILAMFLKFLMGMQKHVKRKPEDAAGKRAKVYLKIPIDGSGLIRVSINGSEIELKAKSIDEQLIATGEEVLVHEYTNGYAMVTKINN